MGTDGNEGDEIKRGNTLGDYTQDEMNIADEKNEDEENAAG
jgi:hypothetical protein